jgi:hypothetical protein
VRRKRKAVTVSTPVAAFCWPCGYALILLQRPFARRLRTLADLNILIMNVHKHLADIARIKPLAAGRAFFEIVGLGLGDAVWIVAFYD